MPRIAEDVETLSVRLTDDDRDLMRALRRRTGINSKGEIARLALRALYQQQAGAAWAPEGNKTGTDG